MKRNHLTQLLVILVLLLSVVLIGSAAAQPTEGQLVRGDVNGDGAINMKDVLLLRKYLADMDVTIADHVCTAAPSESGSETQATESSATQATESSATQATESSATQATESSATQATESSATQATESSATQATETSATQATQTSATQTSATQATQSTQATETSATQATGTTQSQPVADTVALSLSVEEESPRYTTSTRTDSFQVPKNQESTLVITLPGYYKGNTEEMTKLLERVTLTANGTALTPTSVTFGDMVSQKCDVYYTFKINVGTTAVTVAGTVSHPNFEQFGVTVNGNGGSGGSDSTQGSQQTTGTTSPAPVMPTGGENYDLVTLTYIDDACTDYGLSFHSFTDLSSPVIQIVEGTATGDADFASATVISGSNIAESSKTTCEYQNYSPTDYTFTHTYEDRGNVVSGVKTYIYKATLDNLGFGKTYSYRVGDTTLGTYSPIYTFTTRAQTISDFSFIYTADTQPSCFDGSGYVGVNALFNKIFTKAPNAQFLVSGGDFVYCSDEGQSSISVWRNVMNGGNNKNTGAAGSLFAEHPWFIANGNHDANKVQEFMNNDTTSDSTDYYSYDYGNTHFVVLDTGHNGTLDSTQLSWLSGDLSGTTKKWKVIFLHWSLYCTTDRDFGVDKTTLAENSSRTQLLSIIDQNHVDLVVSAHVNESYYTSYPLYGGAKTSDTPTKTGGVDCYTSPSGTIYMQNGGSGLGSDLKGGVKGKLNTNTQDVTVGFRNRLGVLRDAEVGYEASYAVFEISANTLKVNRYYLDASLNSTLYTNGQFQITK